MFIVPHGGAASKWRGMHRSVPPQAAIRRVVRTMLGIGIIHDVTFAITHRLEAARNPRSATEGGQELQDCRCTRGQERQKWTCRSDRFCHGLLSSSSVRLINRRQILSSIAVHVPR